MRSFIKYDFTSQAEPVSAFCLQDSLDKQIFQCLFLYPSGVPNFAFVINLSYERNGEFGSIGVTVDASQTAFALRSLV